LQCVVFMWPNSLLHCTSAMHFISNHNATEIFAVKLSEKMSNLGLRNVKWLHNVDLWIWYGFFWGWMTCESGCCWMDWCWLLRNESCRQFRCKFTFGCWLKVGWGLKATLSTNWLPWFQPGASCSVYPRPYHWGYPSIYPRVILSDLRGIHHVIP